MICDTAAVRIDRPVSDVFDFMTDPRQMDRWSFGTWRIAVDASGLVRGTSIKDGAVTFVRIDGHRETGLIDYFVGGSAAALVPRISARVQDGAALTGAGGTLLTMTALRTDDMDDARWTGLTATHRVELDLIKAALETGYDHRTPKEAQ